MANEENIRKVQKMLAIEGAYFNMRRWMAASEDHVTYPPNICGTPSCIGGWAESCMRSEGHPDPDGDEGVVAEWLGLTYEEGQELFYPSPEAAWDATNEQGIAVLEHVIETGDVDWRAVVGGNSNG